MFWFGLGSIVIFLAARIVVRRVDRGHWKKTREIYGGPTPAPDAFDAPLKRGHKYRVLRPLKFQEESYGVGDIVVFKGAAYERYDSGTEYTFFAVSHERESRWFVKDGDQAWSWADTLEEAADRGSSA
jgi:hypothetical protein